MRRSWILAAVIAATVVAVLAYSNRAKKPDGSPLVPAPGAAPAVELKEAVKLRAAVNKLDAERWLEPALEERVAEALARDPGDQKAADELAGMALDVADRLFNVWIAGEIKPYDILADEDESREVTSPALAWTAADRLLSRALELAPRTPEVVDGVHTRRDAFASMKGKGDVEAAFDQLDPREVGSSSVSRSLMLRLALPILKALAKPPGSPERSRALVALARMGCPACVSDPLRGAGDRLEVGGLACEELPGASAAAGGAHLCPWPEELPPPPPALAGGVPTADLAVAVGLARVMKSATSVEGGAPAALSKAAREASAKVSLRILPQAGPAGPPPKDKPKVRPMAVGGEPGSGIVTNGLLRGVLHVGPEGVRYHDSALLKVGAAGALKWEGGASTVLAGAEAFAEGKDPGPALSAGLARVYAHEGTRSGRSLLAVDAEVPEAVLRAVVEAMKGVPRARPTLHLLAGDRLRVAPMWLLDLGAPPDAWPRSGAKVRVEGGRVLVELSPGLSEKEDPSAGRPSDDIVYTPAAGRAGARFEVPRTTDKGDGLVAEALTMVDARFGPLAAVELESAGSVYDWQRMLAALAGGGPPPGGSDPLGLKPDCGAGRCGTRVVLLRLLPAGG